MARKSFLHFRVDEELSKALDDYATKNKVSRSVAARTLLQTVLSDGTSPEAAAVEQAFRAFHGAVDRAVAKVASGIGEQLQKILQREIQQ